MNNGLTVLEIVLVFGSAFLLSLGIALAINCFEYHEAVKKSKLNCDYITLSYKQLRTFEKYGIKFFVINGCFLKTSMGENKEPIVVMYKTYLDCVRYNHYLDRKEKRAEKEEALSHESKEAYEYLLKRTQEVVDYHEEQSQVLREEYTQLIEETVRKIYEDEIKGRK